MRDAVRPVWQRGLIKRFEKLRVRQFPVLKKCPPAIFVGAPRPSLRVLRVCRIYLLR